MKIINPFVISGYSGPDYFCNRQDESERIMSAISGRRNLTLISLRRMGKTGLLKHIAARIEKEKKKYSVIYADLLPTMEGKDLLTAMSNSLLRARKDEKNFLEKIMGSLSALRPVLTIDSLSGQPTLELKIDSAGMLQSGLDQILELVRAVDRNLIFIFDEFQQISNYPEKNIEHILRTIIQNSPAIHYIFSGSSRHMLENMFASAGKPFYRSTELMYLDRIGQDDYRRFISAHFDKAGIRIDDEAITMIFDWTRLHTWYVQYVCNKLYGSGNKKITPSTVNQVFLQILSESQPEYANYRNLLSSHQFKLLKAIASENGADMPTSGKFIAKHDLTSPSSVKTSLNALSDKEMVINEGGKWLVYDVFFSRWLEYNYSV